MFSLFTYNPTNIIIKLICTLNNFVSKLYSTSHLMNLIEHFRIYIVIVRILTPKIPKSKIISRTREKLREDKLCND